MTAWRLVPITNGYHILTRVFADQVLVGELTLRREDYGDLAARLGAPQAFDTATGRPLPVSSFGEPLWSPQVVQPVPDPVDRVEARLAAAIGWDLWEPNGPSPVDEAVRRLTTVDAQPDEPDLHEGLHPQPGEAPAAPVPPGVEGWTPSHTTPAPPGPIAPHGCDDCCAEPGEPHGWPGCSGITAGEAGERTDDLDVPDGGGVA